MEPSYARARTTWRRSGVEAYVVDVHYKRAGRKGVVRKKEFIFGTYSLAKQYHKEVQAQIDKAKGLNSRVNRAKQRGKAKRSALIDRKRVTQQQSTRDKREAQAREAEEIEREWRTTHIARLCAGLGGRGAPKTLPKKKKRHGEHWGARSSFRHVT